MDLQRVLSITQYAMLGSSKFPYKTGQLHDNFLNGDEVVADNFASFSVLGKPKIEYGMILENAPSIRYRLRKVSAHKYGYIRHTNRHFRYIERIINSDVVSAIENDL